MGAVSLPVLFSADRRSAPLVAVFPGYLDSRWPAGVSRDLLLLPQSVLPGIFPRSAGLRGERTKRTPVPRRNQVSIRPAKCAPLLFLPGGPVPLLSVVRRGARLRFPGRIRNRRRLAGDACEHRPAHHLYILLPLAAS